MIYFIRRPDGGRIKIGNTLRLSARLRELTAEHGPGLEVMAVTDGSFDRERALHGRFAGLRVDGNGQREWFEPGDDLVDFIIRECRAWDGRDEVGTLSVKLRMGVIESARVVAALRGVTITDLISDMVENDLRRMEQEEIDKRAKPARKAAK